MCLRCEMCDTVIYDGDRVEWDGMQAYCESCTVDMLDIYEQSDENAELRCDMCNTLIHDGDRIKRCGEQVYCVDCTVETMDTYAVPDEWDIADFKRKEAV